MTLLAGYMSNWLYATWKMNPRATFGSTSGFVPESVKVAAAVVLIALLCLSMRRTQVPQDWRQLRDKITTLTGVRLTAARLYMATAVGVVLLYLTSGLFTVPPGAVGITLRFGQIIVADLLPGLHYRLPWPLEQHRIVQQDLVRRIEFGFRSTVPGDSTARTLARQRLTVGGPANPVPMAMAATGFWFQKEKVAEEALLLTGDGNIIDISAAAQYRVQDAVAYAYNIADADALVRSVTLAVLREVVGTMPLDTIPTTARGTIERVGIQRIQALLDTYHSGLQMVSLCLLYVHAPEEVHRAFRDVASAQEDKLYTINRAQTFAEEKVNLAAGQAAAMSEEAAAFTEEKVLRAEGDALAFSLRAHAYQAAPDLTRFRLHLEVAENVLPQVQKFLRPGTDDIKELDLWLLEPFGAKKAR
jgi:HflK protein